MCNEILTKQEFESKLDYIYRICGLKDELNYTWCQIAGHINNALGLDYSDSWYRKNYSKHSFPALLLPVVEKSTDISDALLELKMERVKLSDERAQNMAAIRKLAREETLLEIANAAAKELSKKSLLDNFELHTITGAENAILQISDWHYGIEINSPWNRYNPEIARSRISRLRDKVIDLIQDRGIKNLYIANLGDLISGRIHETIRIQNRIDVITQSLEVAEILTEFIAHLSQYCIINYISCSDNHSRLEPKKDLSLDLESLARVIDPILKLRIENLQLQNKCGDVRFIDSPYGFDIAKFNIDNYTIGGVHGHKDSPKAVVQNLTLMTKSNYDLILTAHLHHFNCDEKNDTVVVSNGSLMGIDDYAETLRLTNRPSQNLIMLSKDNVIESIHRIIL